MTRIATLSLCLLFVAASGFAQQPATGFPAFGSFQDGKFDAVNLQNLNAHFEIPIVSSPGRGMNLNFAVTYDTSVWYRATFNNTSSWKPVSDPIPPPVWGWRRNFSFGQISEQGQAVQCKVDPYDPERFAERMYNWIYAEPNGTVHPFGLNFYDIPTKCNYRTTPRTGYASDGSGFYMDATDLNSVIVWGPNGQKTELVDSTSCCRLTDANGNYISFSIGGTNVGVFTDSAGHQALKIDTNTPNQIAYRVLDKTGNYQTTTLKMQSYNVKTNFACSGVVEYTGTVSLPYELDLPNNTKYQFTYEDTPGFSGYTTARVKRITLPTGGYYEYAYTGAHDGINCTDATTLGLTRTISDSIGAATWTYSRSTGTKVTAPQMPYDTAANDTVYTFDANGHETSRKTYQGSSTSGTLLRTVNTTWASNGTPATAVTILEDNQTQSEIDTNLDSWGRLLSTTEKDWGGGSPGATIRTTTFSYLNGAGYGSQRQLITQKIVKDASGTPKSRTDIAYDESGYINGSGNCPTGVAQHDDTNYGCTFTTRGLPTTVTTYTDPVTPGGAVARHSTYDFFGNLRSADSICCQQKTFNYSATTQYSFPDSVVIGASAPQLTTSTTYNPYTGQPVSSTDENGKETTYDYDVYGRLTTTTRPDNAQITTAYDDVNFTVATTAPVQTSSSIVRMTAFDGLGRGLTTATKDGTGTTYSIVKTAYDPMGRAYQVSNPYTGSPAYWTTKQFDALARATTSILPDNSQTTYSYAANSITVTDPTGKQRKSVSDGLGRLVDVYEPDVSNGNQLTQQTTYAYDVLGRLTQVNQGVQTRTYVYDALGRLTDSTTPEAGHFQSQYNSSNLLVQRTDARGVIMTFGYDSLNRLASISYNVGSTGVPATASLSYTYGTDPNQNNNGRLITMTDGVGSESYTYNLLGQVTHLGKTIGSTTYGLDYTYNLAGAVASTTYPSGRVVQQSYDPIGRLCAVGTSGSTCSSGTTYASSFAYNTAQLLTGFNYGNGVTASFGYSVDRLQLTSSSYVQGTNTLLSQSFSYGTAGSNNGQVIGIADGVDNGRNATYAYDALYRLVDAATTGSTAYPKWHLTWDYDRYGNRLDQTVQPDTSPNLQPPAPSNSVTIDPATNRITSTGYSYDANGNMTNDGANTLVYGAENHLLSATNGGSGGAYTYDGKGLRVKKVSGSTTTVYVFSGSQVVAEYDNGAAVGSPTREYIYSGAQLLATITGSTTTYHHPDRLSVRVATNASGNKTGEQGHYPFGESWYTADSVTKWQFTSYERDSESGNDYALARYQVSRLGRFSSPDPDSGSRGDPQSLNRYAYVRSNPTGAIDPSGMVTIPCWECGGGGGGGWDPDAPHLYFMTGGWGLGFGGPLCSADGAYTTCGIAAGLLSSGGGVRCPNNDCAIGTQKPYQCIGDVCGYMAQEYAATHRYEWDGELHTQEEWIEHTQAYRDEMQAKLAEILGVDESKLGDVGLEGGNANFSITEKDGDNFISSDPTCQDGPFGIRCGDVTLHFTQKYNEEDGTPYYTVHMDSANAYSFPLGTMWHFVKDLIGGHTIFSDGVPH